MPELVARIRSGASSATSSIGAPSASYRSDGRAGWNRYDISTEGRRWRVRVETRRWYEAEGLRTDATQVYRVGAESIPPQ